MSSYYEKILATGKVKCIDEEIPFEIPQGWKWCRLSGAVNIIMGQSPNGNDVFEANEVDNAYEFHQGKICFTDKYIAPAGKWCKEPSRIANIGSLLVCVRAPIGDVNITQRQIGIGRGLAAINGYNGIKSDFLFYWLLAHKKMLVDKGTGSTFKAITVEVLKDLIIPIPPLSEQQRIVSKLEEILSFVEHYEQLHNEINSLNAVIYEQLRKSILQEAIQGKLVPQIAEEGTAQELYEQVKAEKQKLVKEGKLKKSALTDSVIYKGDDNKYYEQIGSDIYDITDSIPFDIPDNWNWCRLKDVCSIFTGATFKKEDASTGSKGVRVLRGGNISPFELVMKPDDLFLPYTKIKESILLRKNDIVTPAVTSLENIGKAARVQKDLNDVTVGGFVFILRSFLCNDWLSQYLLALLSSPFMGEYMKSVTNKSGQAFYNIGKERLAMAMIPLPPIREQQRIVAQIERLFEQLK